MNRAVLLCAVLCAAQAVGCKHNKDKQGQDGSGETYSHNDPNAAHHQPDAFETSDDPPLNANTRFAAGQLAESQGDSAKAIAQYREALKLVPNHVNALFRLGALYTQQKRYDEAIPIWQRYVKATNQSPAAYQDLGLCYEQAGRYAEAEKAFQTGIQRAPDDSTCRVAYGLMLVRRGRVADGTAQLRTALAPAEVEYNLGSVFQDLGKKEEARAHFEEALRLDPNLSDAKARLAALK